MTKSYRQYLIICDLNPCSLHPFPCYLFRDWNKAEPTPGIQDGEEVNLTRLEYNALVFLASNPGIVLTRTQIFEAVWNMESDTCHSSVANVIYNLRKKIEPDSRKPTYIKTVLGIGYKFASGE